MLVTSASGSVLSATLCLCQRLMYQCAKVSILFMLRKLGSSA